jgi:hypothetical protein
LITPRLRTAGGCPACSSNASIPSSKA